MKNLIGFTLVALFFSACAPTAPATGIPTTVEITAEMSTVVAETSVPPPTEGPSPTPISATPIPTLPSSSLTPTQLKYKVLEQYPNFFFCDPDLYPVARDDEMTLAQQRFPELQANQEEFQAILSQNGISETTTFTDEQKLLIYREHKKLNAIFFEVVDNRYRFQIQTGTEGERGSLITGTIDADGSMDIANLESSIPTCPICLAAGTRIDTPRGPVAVEDLRLGDPVWTMNAAGERVPGQILKLGSVIVPASHEVIHLVLSDGRELWASPGHPTVDRRRLDDLKVDDSLDGARVILIERLAYGGSKTYDLLPSGETGFYWANGVPLNTTLTDSP